MPSRVVDISAALGSPLPRPQFYVAAIVLSKTEDGCEIGVLASANFDVAHFCFQFGSLSPMVINQEIERPAEVHLRVGR